MEGTAAGVTSSTLSRSSTVEEGDFLEGAEAKLKAHLLIHSSVARAKYALARRRAPPLLHASASAAAASSPSNCAPAQAEA